MFRVKICTALVTIHIHKLFTHSRTHHFIITHTEIPGRICMIISGRTETV